MQLRFMIFPLLQIIALYGLVRTGNWVWLGGGLLFATAHFFDHIKGKSEYPPISERKRFESAALYLSSALQILLLVSFFWYFLNGRTVISALAASPDNDLAHTPAQLVGAIFTVAIFTGTAGGNLGHELIHHRNLFSRFLGRLTLTFCLHTSFAIEHVYGHHRTACTFADPATARRNESLFSFVARSFSGANINAWKLESLRMAKKNLPTLHWKNRSYAGHLGEIFYLAVVFWLSGFMGVVIALFIGLAAIILIESFNYVAHFGLVRIPGQPFEPRHAWNSPGVVASGLTFNITHHSYHHLRPEKRYWQLKIAGDMPVMPHGPSILILIAMIPQIWLRFIHPHLQHWDKSFASPAELDLLRNLYGK